MKLGSSLTCPNVSAICPYPEPVAIQSKMPPHLLKIHLILSSHMRLVSQVFPFPQVSTTEPCTRKNILKDIRVLLMQIEKHDLEWFWLHRTMTFAETHQWHMMKHTNDTCWHRTMTLADTHQWHLLTKTTLADTHQWHVLTKDLILIIRIDFDVNICTGTKVNYMYRL
jgi:hypothetical protein